MPNWWTAVNKKAALDPRTAGLNLEMICVSVICFRIPKVGTRWSTKLRGSKVIIFAEWNIEDEIAAGIYDDTV